MTDLRIGRAIPWCVALAVAGSLFAVGPAAAEAVREPFSNTESSTFTDVSGCTGLTGEGTNTTTTTGYILTAGRTFHVVGVITQDNRIDWSDGTYLITHSPTHFSFNTNSQTFVYTESQQDPGILYSADGEAIGKVTVIGGFHITWRDVNGNGELDPDELIVSTDHGHVRCA